MPGLRPSEWIALAYFCYLAILATTRRDHLRHRSDRVTATSCLVIASVLILGTQPARTTSLLRDWMPLVWLVTAYWLPALLVAAPNETFEQKLLGLDRRLLGMGDADRKKEDGPVGDILEAAYLFCYPLVPFGFVCLTLVNGRGHGDRFWAAVLPAAFVCYGLLPWIPTRPPRSIEPARVRRRSFVRSMNLHVLDRASVQLNTFPSGHAAASVATALAVAAQLPFTGLLFGLIALGIVLGSVVGRYHYAADAVAGVLLGVLTFTLSRL